MPRAEWHNRSDFAEVAEALGVPTDEIAGLMAREGRVTVLFGLDEIQAATLERNGEGVFEEVGERMVVGSWDEWKRNLDEHMRRFEP